MSFLKCINLTFCSQSANKCLIASGIYSDKRNFVNKKDQLVEGGV